MKIKREIEFEWDEKYFREISSRLHGNKKINKCFNLFINDRSRAKQCVGEEDHRDNFISFDSSHEKYDVLLGVPLWLFVKNSSERKWRNLFPNILTPFERLKKEFKKQTG